MNGISGISANQAALDAQMSVLKKAMALPKETTQKLLNNVNQAYEAMGKGVNFDAYA